MVMSVLRRSWVENGQVEIMFCDDEKVVRGMLLFGMGGWEL